MSTAILTPSLGRPQYFRSVVENIERATPEPHTQIWCIGEPGYHLDYPPHSLMVLDDTTDPDKRYVARMNKLALAARMVVGVEFIFFGQDDVIYHDGWLSAAMGWMVEGVDVVLVNDDRKEKGTQALMRSSYAGLAVFDDPTAVFHPGYVHNFADDEQHETARQRGVLAMAPDSHVEHLNPLLRAGDRQYDDTYRLAQGKWSHDAQLFGQRMARMKDVLG